MYKNSLESPSTFVYVLSGRIEGSSTDPTIYVFSTLEAAQNWVKFTHAANGEWKKPFTDIHYWWLVYDIAVGSNKKISMRQTIKRRKIMEKV